MAGTTTKGFPYPQDADAVDVAGDIQSLAESVDDYFSATASSVAETYLPISASSSLSPIGYLTEATASATYLTITDAATTYLPISASATLGGGGGDFTSFLLMGA